MAVDKKDINANFKELFNFLSLRKVLSKKSGVSIEKPANFEGEYLDLLFDGVNEVTKEHHLGQIPEGYLVVRASGNVNIWLDDTATNYTKVKFKSNNNNVKVRVLLF